MSIAQQKRKEKKVKMDNAYHCPRCFCWTAHDMYYNPPLDVYICRVCGNRLEFKHEEKK